MKRFLSVCLIAVFSLILSACGHRHGREFLGKWVNGDRPKTLDDLQNRIALIEDREEIRDLIERYAEAADHRNDPELMYALFAENAVWEAPASDASRAVPRF